MTRPLVEKLFFAALGIFLLAVFACIGVYLVLSRDLPQLPDTLEKINLSLPTEIYSVDGERVAVLGERRPVPIEDISPDFLKAIIAVEDASFYRHKGVDHLALFRAMFRNLREKRIAQGGSTITQQLSKNLFFSFERNWVRKIKELLIALQMEATFTKQRILEAYCNQVYFGNGAYGVEDASRVYFAKRAKDLTLLQAALLSGLPNSPNNANPFTNYDRAVRRADYALDRMVKAGAITPRQKEDALASSLELADSRGESDPNLYFIDYVVGLLEEDYGKDFVHFGGTKIFTTLDARLQKFAMKAAENHLEDLDKKMREADAHGPLQVALVAIENRNGAVRVLLGGRNYSRSQFNRAVSSNRLPGSSFKPFVYLTAMETLGYSPATVVKDEPITIDIPGSSPWEPQNFEDEFAGDIVLKKALMRSINVVSAKLVQATTPARVIETARQFGITSPLGNHLSLALGTSGVSPLEMAAAYSAIANLGVYNKPYFVQWIEDYNGNRLYEHFYLGIQRFPQKSVYPLLDMMKGVVEGGTGSVVRKMGFEHPAGGKTGTTNDFKDTWFDGFTKDLAVSVWVGYDDNHPMRDTSRHGLTGSAGAAPIWVNFMQKALEGKNKINFPVPAGIKFEKVDPQTGHLAEGGSPEGVEVAVKEETQLRPPP
ncbi:MAG: PBP1A family penicillin-binding protein [Nitrospinae bacterium]|nr:PBP1A family penicillin-binding protein [Nitrospinota bacterium]